MCDWVRTWVISCSFSFSSKFVALCAKLSFQCVLNEVKRRSTVYSASSVFFSLILRHLSVGSHIVCCWNHWETSFMTMNNQSGQTLKIPISSPCSSSNCKENAFVQTVTCRLCLHFQNPIRFGPLSHIWKEFFSKVCTLLACAKTFGDAHKLINFQCMTAIETRASGYRLDSISSSQTERTLIEPHNIK